MSKPKLAWIQGASKGNTRSNLEYYSNKIQELAKNSPDIVVLPELFLNDYFPIVENDENFKLAKNTDSPEIKHFVNLAKELKIILILPFFEKADNSKYYNSVFVIEKTGEVIGHYRKLHIPFDPGFYEKYYFTPGDKGYVVCNTSAGKIAVLICFDQWFPEAARSCALQGAELIIYPTAIGWDDKEPENIYSDQLEAWINVNRSHAIANNVYVLAVNRVGREDHLKFWGNSFLSNPYGKIIKKNSLDEEVSIAELDFTLISECRKVWTFFRDRRTDTYQELLKEY